MEKYVPDEERVTYCAILGNKANESEIGSFCDVTKVYVFIKDGTNAFYFGNANVLKLLTDDHPRKLQKHFVLSNNLQDHFFITSKNITTKHCNLKCPYTFNK